MGRSAITRAVISAMASLGNASGAGLPADREITCGSAAYLNISRIAEGLSACTLSENTYSILKRSFHHKLQKNFRAFLWYSDIISQIIKLGKVKVMKTRCFLQNIDVSMHDDSSCSLIVCLKEYRRCR